MQNTDVLHGQQLAGELLGGVITATTTAQALQTASRRILWIIVQNLGTVNLFVGGSAITNTGSGGGVRATPTGSTPLLPIRDLSQVFVVAASSTCSVTWVAGVAPSRDSDEA